MCIYSPVGHRDVPKAPGVCTRVGKAFHDAGVLCRQPIVPCLTRKAGHCSVHTHTHTHTHTRSHIQTRPLPRTRSTATSTLPDLHAPSQRVPTATYKHGPRSVHGPQPLMTSVIPKWAPSHSKSTNARSSNMFTRASEASLRAHAHTHIHTHIYTHLLKSLGHRPYSGAKTCTTVGLRLPASRQGRTAAV